MAFYDSLGQSLQWLSGEMNQRKIMTAAGQGLEGMGGQGGDQAGQPQPDHAIATKANQANIKSTADMMGRAKQYYPIVAAAASKYGVPAPILMGLLQQESDFNPDLPTGKAGEIGIAQFIPGTARDYGVNPVDVSSSIDGAARYLADSYKKTKNWGAALAIYNSGGTNDPTYVSAVGRNAANWAKVIQSGAMGGPPGPTAVGPDAGLPPGTAARNGTSPLPQPASASGAAAGSGGAGGPAVTSGSPATPSPDALPSANPTANLNDVAGGAFGPGFTIQGLVNAIRKANPNIKPNILAGALEYLRPLMSQQALMQYRQGELGVRQDAIAASNDRNAASNATRENIANVNAGMRQAQMDQNWKKFLMQQDVATKRVALQEDKFAEQIKKDEAALANSNDKNAMAKFKTELDTWQRLNAQLNTILRAKIAASNMFVNDPTLAQEEQKRYEAVQAQIAAMAHAYGFDPATGPAPRKGPTPPSAAAKPPAAPSGDDPLGIIPQ